MADVQILQTPSLHWPTAGPNPLTLEDEEDEEFYPVESVGYTVKTHARTHTHKRPCCGAQGCWNATGFVLSSLLTAFVFLLLLFFQTLHIVQIKQNMHKTTLLPSAWMSRIRHRKMVRNTQQAMHWLTVSEEALGLWWGGIPTKQKNRIHVQICLATTYLMGSRSARVTEQVVS